MPHSPDRPDRILAAAKRIAARQAALRRHLHQYPELSAREFRTSEYLAAALRRLGLRLLATTTDTGVLAELQGVAGGRTVVVRSDIDALPITERTGLPFASKNPGCMHACGHDMHMAVVWGVAAVLSGLRGQIAGTVRFIFQPSEEMPPGGARPMIESGALTDASAVFGLHVDPHVRTGKIGLRDGPTMAAVTDFDLIVRGRSAHAARPHLGVDAITTAAEVIEAVQKVVAREIDPVEPAVITFGQIEGGVARNVVADEVRVAGTARTLSPRAEKAVPRLIRRVAENIGRARGARVELRLIADYPVLSNDPRANRVLARNMERLYGRGKIETTEVMLGGEDFACYLKQAPGAMVRLGVGNRKIKADQPWHSPAFIADEAALPVGTALLAAAVLDVLSGGLA
ncbi:MAG TPA: M20 family metallopeptidase [candidate division Zixibacteria bacterium]|nr:amidohydrolase [candidate division Zixibacteria bacterium]MDD4917365.1 M20 family metallopeptidase [candidate division Zixibacteria bacterium]MDM7971923.1 M20 family metallopeptidase [candidate division Zixibacteria bacterium]HOD66243.1 M20 family metallopeptidase [candidate division Zixibacteria bacterium]HPC10522.1 M20 family metallopeptidase [candidate division Zixibacteria bacterium]